MRASASGRLCASASAIRRCARSLPSQKSRRALRRKPWSNSAIFLGLAEDAVEVGIGGVVAAAVLICRAFIGSRLQSALARLLLARRWCRVTLSILVARTDTNIAEQAADRFADRLPLELLL